MKRYMDFLIRSAEKRADHFLNHQVWDKHSRFYGGMSDTVLNVKPTVYALSNMSAVYLNAKSRYYQKEKVLEAIHAALVFIEKNQRMDGSFDFPSCNFHSAPDTSFCFKRLIASYRLFQRFSPDSEYLEIKQTLYRIMERSLHALLYGGFHTPNHRWGIAAALMQGAELVHNTDQSFAQALRKRAEQYLQEGIDGNKDGEYAERSTGNYNAVVNQAMMSMYEETKDETYLGYMERNLKMMLYYMEPDGTIFTQNSTRQDQGKRLYPDKYFYQYLYMAVCREKEIYANAAHKIIRDCQERGDLAPDCLHILMLHPQMEQYELKGCGFLQEYRKYFEESGVLRVKNTHYGYTILKDKAAFLYLSFGATKIHMKIGESYCDIRNFIPEKLERKEDGYKLEGSKKGWYYLPFQEKQTTSDWWKMDHGKRELLYGEELSISVEVSEQKYGIEVCVQAKGLDRLPLRVEICIPAGSILENDQFYLKTQKGESLILRNGMVSMHCGENVIDIGPGYGTHEFEGHYSGEEKNSEGYTIFFNEYTPYEKRFSICCREGASI